MKTPNRIGGSVVGDVSFTSGPYPVMRGYGAEPGAVEPGVVERRV
jgi:hypothetical protein